MFGFSTQLEGESVRVSYLHAHVKSFRKKKLIFSETQTLQNI
jgi:hypothetical protein